MNNGKLKGTIRPQGALKGRISRVIETVDPVIQPLEVAENGEYTAPENVHGFSPVKVDVPLRYDEGYQDGCKAIEGGLQEKEITANGEYTADEGHTGFKKVNVNVSFDNIGKPYIDTSKLDNFVYFFASGYRYNEEIARRLDTSNGVNFSKMFYQALLLKEIYEVFDTSKGTNFSEMFYNCPRLTAIPQLNTSNGTAFNGMFYKCSTITTIPQLDTSKGTTFADMFEQCSSLVSVPYLDTGNGVAFGEMFINCKALKEIPFPLDLRKMNSANSMFYGCTSLETVSLTTSKSDLSTNTFNNCTALKNITIGEGWAVNIYLNYSNELTVESLHGMIENLADLTGKTAKTFKVGTTNLAKIDEAHMQMLNNKNWAYS